MPGSLAPGPQACEIRVRAPCGVLWPAPNGARRRARWGSVVVAAGAPSRRFPWPAQQQWSRAWRGRRVEGEGGGARAGPRVPRRTGARGPLGLKHARGMRRNCGHEGLPTAPPLTGASRPLVGGRAQSSRWAFLRVMCDVCVRVAGGGGRASRRLRLATRPRDAGGAALRCAPWVERPGRAVCSAPRRRRAPRVGRKDALCVWCGGHCVVIDAR